MGNGGIFLIAVFDLVKAVLFLVAAAGVFHLVDRNTHVELTRLLHVFRLSGDHAFVKRLLGKADDITDPDKRILTWVLLLYTGMYAVEGIGLLLRKRWAEYLRRGDDGDSAALRGAYAAPPCDAPGREQHVVTRPIDARLSPRPGVRA